MGMNSMDAFSLAIAAAQAYTDETVEGGGAIKGKNCTIKSIEDVDNSHVVTFEWTLDDGTVKIGSMTVVDGAPGADGKGIKSVAINEYEHLIITYTDDTTVDAGKIEITAAVDSVNGKTGDVTLTPSDIGALPSNTPIPSKTSDLTNDSSFVSDANYTHTDNNYDATAKSIVDGVTNALSNKVNTSSVGAANGVAELDENGKVPTSQLPGSIDHIIEAYYNETDGKFYEESTYETEITPQSNIIYVSLDTNKTYRWGGTQYVEISESLALGETSQTAYRGDHGKANADAITAIKNGTTLASFGDVETALGDKISKSNTSGLMKNDGTVDTTQYLSQHQDITSKADKVQSAVNGNFVGLDANGNITDSGKKASDFLTQHQDISGKADKVQSPTANNFAALNASGNLIDSGKKASDFATATNLANYINENGAINQFNITLDNTKSVNTGGTWSDNAFTYRGLTYTVNADNIVITGTPTDNSFFYLLAKNIPAGRYTFGGLKDAANIIWDGGFWIYNGNVETQITTSASGTKNDFTVDLSNYTFDRIKFGIKRKSNVLTNDTIKLFIRKADIDIDVDAPYAKTNKKLTDDIADIVERGIIKPNYQIKNVEFDIYWTGDAAPTGAWSTQNATDFAQAIYDFFQKCGGNSHVVYTGRIRYYSRKASDGTELGSSWGWYTLYSTQSYTSMLADNSVARLSFDYRLYGTTVSSRYGIWGKSIMRSSHGINAVGTLSDTDEKVTYNTISS